MAGFLYFIANFHSTPGHNRPDDAALQSMGLGHLVGATLTVAPINNRRGPNQSNGVMLAVDNASLIPSGRRVGKVRFDADSQLWRDWGGKFWLGYDKADPPRPDDLVRADAFERHHGCGYRIQMSNGSSYLIPPYRMLPSTIIPQPDGTIERAAKPEFAPLAEQARRVYRTLADYADFVADGGEDADAPGMDTDEAIPIATAFLGVLYRIGLAEAAALALWDDAALAMALKAIVDYPSFEKMAVEAMGKSNAKKKKKSKATA